MRLAHLHAKSGNEDIYLNPLHLGSVSTENGITTIWEHGSERNATRYFVRETLLDAVQEINQAMQGI